MQEQIDEYLNYCEVVRGMSEATLRQKRSVLFRFARVTGVSSVEQMDDKCFDAWMRENSASKASSVNMYNSIVMSFVTDLQRRGASVAEIKEMMGHENIATTERYMHGFDGRMQELFDKYR